MHLSDQGARAHAIEVLPQLAEEARLRDQDQAVVIASFARRAHRVRDLSGERRGLVLLRRLVLTHRVSDLAHPLVDTTRSVALEIGLAEPRGRVHEVGDLGQRPARFMLEKEARPGALGDDDEGAHTGELRTVLMMTSRPVGRSSCRRPSPSATVRS